MLLDYRQAHGRGDGRLEEGSLGTYNDDGSINVETTRWYND